MQIIYTLPLQVQIEKMIFYKTFHCIIKQQNSGGRKSGVQQCIWEKITDKRCNNDQYHRFRRKKTFRKRVLVCCSVKRGIYKLKNLQLAQI